MAPTTRTSIRVNLPKNGEKRYMSRAMEKTTNLALTVVSVFMITNLPFMVYEFMRQGIISYSWYVSKIRISLLRLQSSNFLPGAPGLGVKYWMPLLA